MESLKEEWNACAFHYKPCYFLKSQIYGSHCGFEIENFDYCFNVKQNGVKIKAVTVLQNYEHLFHQSTKEF